ncbi:uncharacterized protein LOC120429561 [Culex pipiens pallens]|uniref:uncharacterized protein LOC120429561 n=1 Tax=Culex pipiens pallens TaxID=42434 RepID=UPI0019532404|nr:uncharacterized protein LOC120429561 [Culex pipiens pallens]
MFGVLHKHPEEQFAPVLEEPSVRKQQVLKLSYSDYFQRLERYPTNLIKKIYLEYRRSHRNSRPQTLISRRRSFGRMNWQHLCHSRRRTMRSGTIGSGASLPSRKTSTYLPELTPNGQLLQACPDDGRRRDHPVLYIAVALQNVGRDVKQHKQQF